MERKNPSHPISKEVILLHSMTFFLLLRIDLEIQFATGVCNGATKVQALRAEYKAASPYFPTIFFALSDESITVPTLAISNSKDLTIKGT